MPRPVGAPKLLVHAMGKKSPAVSTTSDVSLGEMMRSLTRRSGSEQQVSQGTGRGRDHGDLGEARGTGNFVNRNCKFGCETVFDQGLAVGWIGLLGCLSGRRTEIYLN
jgi:hypothetical protein